MSLDCKFVYRVLKRNEFNQFKKTEVFTGNFLDKQSGFVHLSTRKQISETVKKYFFDEKDIVLVRFKVADFRHKLKWEKSRNKELFPHFYGTLLYDWASEII